MVSKSDFLEAVKYSLGRFQEEFKIESSKDISFSFEDGKVLVSISLGTKCPDYVYFCGYLAKVLDKKVWVIERQDFNFIKPNGSINKSTDVSAYLSRVKEYSDVRIVYTLRFAEIRSWRVSNLEIMKSYNRGSILKGRYASIFDVAKGKIGSLYKDYLVCYKDKEGVLQRELVEALDPDSAFELFRVSREGLKESVDYTFVEAREQGNLDNMEEYEQEPRMIYSDSLDEYVVLGFTIFDKREGSKHYTWNDYDCVYYWDDADDDYYQEVPKGAILDV